MFVMFPKLMITVLQVWKQILCSYNSITAGLALYIIFSSHFTLYLQGGSMDPQLSYGFSRFSDIVKRLCTGVAWMANQLES